jgi:hypothetical protein
MNSENFLKLQLRLLTARFGRKSVLEALGSLSGSALDPVEADIAGQEGNKLPKAPKREKTVEEIVASLPLTSKEARESILELGHLYEAKQFLPNLRDAEEFLRRNGAPARKPKSRRAARAPVLRALSEVPLSELASLVHHTKAASGQSDFLILANQLMGKGQ